MVFGRSWGVQAHGMDHTMRFPRTLAGFGLACQGKSILMFCGKLIGFIAPEMVPCLSNKSEDQSGGPRTNLAVFGDEVTFQYFQKNMKIDFPDAM
jgi:hypothetical protein